MIRTPTNPTISADQRWMPRPAAATVDAGGNDLVAYMVPRALGVVGPADASNLPAVIRRHEEAAQHAEPARARQIVD